jgi:hypothetical protein
VYPARDDAMTARFAPRGIAPAAVGVHEAPIPAFMMPI